MNLLKQLELDELSLVDRPANAQAKVALFKRDSNEDDMEKAYKMTEEQEKNLENLPPAVRAKIRENMKKMRGASEYDIVNLSINQTLKRTILTSVSTALSLIAILLIGGQALRGLTSVLLLGVVVGTYSSIYIASSCMLAVKALPTGKKENN